MTRHFVCDVPAPPAPPAPEPVLFHQAHGTTGIGSVHVVYAIVPAVPPAAPPAKRFIQSCQFQPLVPLTSMYQVPVHERVSVPLI